MSSLFVFYWEFIIHENTKVISKDTEELKKKQADQARQFSSGWEKAFNEYVDSATNAATVAENLFKKAMSGMEDAIVNFAKTGKFQFKNFVAMMAEELLRSQVRQLMANIMLGTKSLTGGGGILSGIGKLLGFASGGVVSGGNPILVGERGPELFVPSRAGTIIPNNGDLSGVIGGQQVVYNGPYIANMQAIDTQSATQFLAKNKTAVWAANQSAQRGLPQSR